jgi:hypothetical protein
MEYDARMAILDKGLMAFTNAKQLRNDYFEAISYENLIYREKMKYDISPAQAVVWRQKADELLQQAMEIQNRAKAAAGQAPAGTQAGGAGQGESEGGTDADPADHDQPTEPQSAEGG